jgi:hypothetical protein
MDTFAIDHDFEKEPIWSPFLDQTDLEVMAEALDFYLQHLSRRDPVRESVVCLIRHLCDCSAFKFKADDLKANWADGEVPW